MWVEPRGFDSPHGPPPPQQSPHAATHRKMRKNRRKLWKGDGSRGATVQTDLFRGASLLQIFSVRLRLGSEKRVADLCRGLIHRDIKPVPEWTQLEKQMRRTVTWCQVVKSLRHKAYSTQRHSKTTTKWKGVSSKVLELLLGRRTSCFTTLPTSRTLRRRRRARSRGPSGECEPWNLMDVPTPKT